MRNELGIHQIAQQAGNAMAPLRRRDIHVGKIGLVLCELEKRIVIDTDETSGARPGIPDQFRAALEQQAEITGPDTLTPFVGIELARVALQDRLDAGGRNGLGLISGGDLASRDRRMFEVDHIRCEI